MAANVTTPFAVTATVVRGCIIATTDLAFGVYPAIAVPPAVLATSTIRVTCELGDTYSIGLNNGSNAAGAQRRMARTTTPLGYLSYNLFQDPARTVPLGRHWQTRQQPSVPATRRPTPSSVNCPAAQVVPVGAYVDTVRVTVRN